MKRITQKALREALAPLGAALKLYSDGPATYAGTGDRDPWLFVHVCGRSVQAKWKSGDVSADLSVMCDGPASPADALAVAKALRVVVRERFGEDAWPWRDRQADGTVRYPVKVVWE